MSTETDSARDRLILEQIEQNPDATQASLAAQLGVAVGTVNWHLKRLIAKGYVKVRRAERRKLRYIITPEGIALRAHLTFDYIQNQFRLYRMTRNRVGELLNRVRQAGFDSVYLTGEGDVADVCRLTCMEHGVTVLHADGRLDGSALHYPLLEVHGLKVSLRMEEDGS
jgi:DNA-binding MarR family transcriptional regulator